MQILLWGMAAIALAGFAMLLLLREPGMPSRSAETPATLGGPFTLTGTDGRAFSSHQLDGKPYAIFFAFTHCPDVCPTTLARLIRLRRQLDGGSDKLNIVFVTVDPERDPPAELGQYLAMFHEPIIGLTGTPAQIERVKRQFGIYSEKVAQQAADYTVDHTATVLLFDRQGRFVATIAASEGDGPALAKLQRIAGARVRNAAR